MGDLRARLRRIEADQDGDVVLAIRDLENFDGCDPSDLVRLVPGGEVMPAAAFWRRYGERGRLITVEYTEADRVAP